MVSLIATIVDPSPFFSFSTSLSNKTDVGTWGLRSHCDRNGRAFGLCTESLGSESSYDGSAGEKDEEHEVMGQYINYERRKPVNRVEGKRKVFPPPLTSLMGDGGGNSAEKKTISFMKAERIDGRLLLREVTIKRPQVLHASREDGHLKLRYTKHEHHHHQQQQQQQQQDERVEVEAKTEQEKQLVQEIEHVEEKDEDEGQKPESHHQFYEKEEEREMEKWRWIVEEGDYYTRCTERSNNNLARFWRNNTRFVTTA